MSSAQWRDRIVSLERIPASELQSHAGNWRLHPAHQQQALAGVLDEIGQAAALLVYHSARQGGLCIIDGHLRSSLDTNATWPCLVLDVTDQEADLLLATLDPLAAMAQADDMRLDALLRGLSSEHEAVTALLAQLADPGTDPGGTAGVDPRARAHEGEGDEHVKVARMDTLRQHYGVEPDQLWACGAHRLLCADSTSMENVKKLTQASGGGVLAQLVVTSPPYWVGRGYEQEHGAAEIKGHITRQASALAGLLGGRCHVVINTGTTTARQQGGEVREVWLLLEWWQEALRAHDLYMRNVRIWAKEGVTFSSFTPEQDVVGQKWEFLASFTRAKPRAQNRLGEKWALDGVWDCAPVVLMHGEGHTAVYPVEIPWRYLTLYTDPGDLVYDPYLGAGTTLIAAEQLGRTCYGMEIDPGFVALTLDRYERSTLQNATARLR